MSLNDAMAARQRFYDILASASVAELDGVRVHVGLVALLTASYRFDFSLQTAAGGMRSATALPRDKAVAGKMPAVESHRDWLPDHLHYNYLLRHAPADLARQLDLASARVKAEAPEPHLFFGYARLGLAAGQLRELMELSRTMHPKLAQGLRNFAPEPASSGDAERLAASG